VKPTAFFAAMTLTLATPVLASNWELDSAHTSAEFKVRHLMISNVPGKFSGVKGFVNLDDANPAKSKVEATIDTSTVNTDNQKRDEHLRSGDFFDVKKFPTMKFVSRSVKKTGDGTFEVAGDLTMHGVSKPVVLQASLTPEMKDPFGGTRRGMTATTKINRKDFGLNWNKALEAGGVMVSDDVNIEINSEMTKK